MAFTVRRVPARQGVTWFRQGLEMFAARPAVWVGITLLFFLMAVVVSAVPFAGMLWAVAVPIHLGGLMLGCDALVRGRELEVRHLFQGFEPPRVRPLALLGVLYFVGCLAFMLPAVLLVVGSTFVSAAVVGAHPTAAVTALSVTFVAGLALLVQAGAVALGMAIWFAPALVVFDGVDALEALKWSLHAAWRNVGAFAVYVLSMCATAVAIVAPLVGAIALSVIRGTRQPEVLTAVIIGGTGLFAAGCLVLLCPASWGAMYASYRDVYGRPDAGAAVSAPPRLGGSPAR